MGSLRWSKFLGCVLAGCAAGLLATTAPVADAVQIPSTIAGSFAFPSSMANGVSGNLVASAGGTSKLSFDTGMVAVGQLPSPLPLTAGSMARRRQIAPRFLRTPDAGPHVRMFLSGVIDSSGSAVSNTGNQLVIDAVVSPSDAATPPFVVPFDISDGGAFVDALLPIQLQSGRGVQVQVLGVTLLDPDKQPFAVLGFELPPAPPTKIPPATPTPGGGDCSDRPLCAGTCTVQCPDGHVHSGSCRPDMGCSCSADCGETPTPTPGPCGDGADCSGACVVTCADGTSLAGQCVGGANNRCECSVTCGAPTPCGGGQCFDTITQRCTGQPCGAGLRCALPNQVCDLSGRRCPCEQPSPPPLPHGHVCCECKSSGPACFDFGFVEVQPSCPPGCETFAGQACDPASDSCAPLAPCSTDKDCDDGNGCTIDQCTPDGCTHACACVGPGPGCGPGPTGSTHR